jgi:hypothetical protein
MTQQTIQVGATPNDGQGTPLRNSFIICNSNFTELYARAQVAPPVTLKGNEGDLAGWYAYDSQYFYYCFADYVDGVDDIWAQVSQVGNVSVSLISNGNSNVVINGIDGNVITSIASVANVVVVNPTGQYVTGIMSATGNIRGSYILGNGSQLTGLPALYSNSNVTALLSNFGSNTISSTGNITSSNVVATTLSATGNVRASQQISATGNITTAGFFVGDFIGNVIATISNLPGPGGAVIYNNGAGNAAATAGLVFDNSSPNVLTVIGSYSATSNVIAGNVLTGGLISATGNVTGGNLSGNSITGTLTTAAQPNITSVGTLSSLTVTANVTGGNLTTGGRVSATGNISTANFLSVGQDINGGGNVTATNYRGTSASLSGNVTGGFILGNIAFANGLPPTNTIQSGNSNVLVGSSAGNVSINVRGTSPIALFTPLGQTLIGTLSATGTVTVGNVATGGAVSATGEVTGANLRTNGTVSASGNITGDNIIASANLYYNGNVLLTTSLTVGTRSSPVTIPLTAAGSFSVGTRSSGNVIVTTST